MAKNGFKKTSLMENTLAVAHINGFLDAVSRINQSEQVNCYYFLTQLEERETLLTTVNENIAERYPHYSVETWNTSLEPVARDVLENSVGQWFSKFVDAKYQTFPLSSLKGAFLDMLSPFLVSASIYRINMTPPVFYAIDWEEFVIDGKLGKFLLSFEFSD